jgi:hypothetical protein
VIRGQVVRVCEIEEKSCFGFEARDSAYHRACAIIAVTLIKSIAGRKSMSSES